MRQNSYLAVTPARDEESFLPGLIESMVAQTRLPEVWILIDDGSTDATPRIMDEAAAKYSWIRVHHTNREGPREPGGEGVVMRFLSAEERNSLDFIFRLDADLSFGPQLAESMMGEFERDSTLGIASAVLYEPCADGWQMAGAPGFHTRGATKMYSRECFRAIGGLTRGLGWDTIDEVRASMLGFTTRSFSHITARHHRPAGAAGGRWRAGLAPGIAAYQAGYSPLFMLARAAYRITDRPYVLQSVLLMAGYLRGYLNHEKRAADKTLIRFIRRHQHRRLLGLQTIWR
ncbi:MAG: glycosyltransferase family A protein [Candidatus Binatus sp.]|uniref:glycosyltransferase family 2 protein n=1 Tax=Candidatus Binatus sp. TaxID=2811406 RepID=UPI002719F31F|nr:glycosyltransferase family A protein [Candidatus Binatus sp.]MDO8432686.1 glycosyltransferase family A protein [Candidatus Binatus sp.]